MAVCQVCFRHCDLQEGRTGFCGARVCRDGEVTAANYGRITSLALDPIEKKPLARFHPGSLILSVGSYGCNLRCPFCQNHEISWSARAFSQAENAEVITPQELAETAAYYRSRGNIGLAFTYNEPLIGWEFVRDTARLVHERGMVMNLIREAVTFCHVELTTLIVPGENDSPEEMEELSAWIAGLTDVCEGASGRDIPLHVSRFFPRFHMTDRPPTDVGRVYQLAETARKRLRYVYTGNC